MITARKPIKQYLYNQNTFNGPTLYNLRKKNITVYTVIIIV